MYSTLVQSTCPGSKSVSRPVHLKMGHQVQEIYVTHDFESSFRNHFSTDKSKDRVKQDLNRIIKQRKTKPKSFCVATPKTCKSTSLIY